MWARIRVRSRGRTSVRAIMRAGVRGGSLRAPPFNRADIHIYNYVPRAGAQVAQPPKLNGCGKLQIFILSVKKLENSPTHDFAQHISA